MVPEPSNGLPCHRIVVETATVVSEHGELLSSHHVRQRFGLDTTPNIPNVSFKHLGNGWRDWPVLVVFGYLEGVCYR